jgi:bifunctional DNA-binding transcriptional regulator/antitoxin component of YhaV-PrlF toxin-antitoxin module
MQEQIEIKNEVDKQGKLVLPKEWRERYLKSREVVMRFKGAVIEIMPYVKVDLTKYFDSVEADIKADLSDWQSVKRELYEIR